MSHHLGQTAASGVQIFTSSLGQTFWPLTPVALNLAMNSLIELAVRSDKKPCFCLSEHYSLG